LFIWIGYNIAKAYTTVGLIRFFKICNFKLNSLILNNIQPISFRFIANIIWIGIISKLFY